jgi:acyl-CoA dehydrogenase
MAALDDGVSLMNEAPSNTTDGIDQLALWPPLVDPAFTAELRSFTQRVILPEADRIDSEDLYPTEIVRAMARAGYNTITGDPAHGGGGKSYRHAAAVLEEVSVASAAVGVSVITIFQAQTMLRQFGSESLKARYLPAFREGLLSSYALTEANRGSDIRSLDTRAWREGENWILRGEKHFITSGVAAEFFVTLAETEKGVTVFAVPREASGVRVYEGANSATFGLRNGPHMNVAFDDVRLPADHMIGEEGRGVRQAATVLNYSRTLAGAVSIGIARAAYEAALAYLRDRVAFDRRVIEFQGIQWYFADMLSEIDAARLLVYHAAQALDEGQQISRWGSEAKLKASIVATEVAGRAAQACGAYGIRMDAPFGRYLRDAKAYEVAGGSIEILRNTIGKAILPIAGLDTRAGKGAPLK